MLSKKRKPVNKAKEPCFFLEKLFKILKTKKNNDIIKWSEDGTKIIILDTIKFSNTILPNNFKHNNYSSFVRQLNIYDFHKINNIYKSNKEQFYNENFKRDMKIEEIRNIRRKDLMNDNDGNLSEKEIKEQILLLEQINKETDDSKKIEKYKKIIDNGNINIKTNINLLNFLIKKNKERSNFYDKIQKDIIALKINYAKIQTNFGNNKNLKVINDINKNEYNNNFIFVKNESFTLNENKKFREAFKNVNVNKIEKSNDNKMQLNASFCDELSMLAENPKNNLNAPSKMRSSYIFLNKSGFLLEPNYNNRNDNTILKNNLTNSFL